MRQIQNEPMNFAQLEEFLNENLKPATSMEDLEKLNKLNHARSMADLERLAEEYGINVIEV